MPVAGQQNIRRVVVGQQRKDLLTGFGDAFEADDRALPPGRKVLVLQLAPGLWVRNESIPPDLADSLLAAELTDPIDEGTTLLLIRSVEEPAQLRSLTSWLDASAGTDELCRRMRALADVMEKLEVSQKFFFPWISPSAFLVGSDERPRLIGQAIDFDFTSGEPPVNPELERFIEEGYWHGRVSNEVNGWPPKPEVKARVMRYGLLQILTRCTELKAGEGNSLHDRKGEALEGLRSFLEECNGPTATQLLTEPADRFYSRLRTELQIQPGGGWIGEGTSPFASSTGTVMGGDAEPPLLMSDGKGASSFRSGFDPVISVSSRGERTAAPRGGAAPMVLGLMIGLGLAVGGFWGWHTYYNSEILFQPWSYRQLKQDRDRYLTDVVLRRWAQEPENREAILKVYGERLIDNVNYRYVVAATRGDEIGLLQLEQDATRADLLALPADDPRRPRFSVADVQAIRQLLLRSRVTESGRGDGATTQPATTP